MFFKELNINFPSIEQILTSDASMSALFYEQFSNRVFYAGQVGITSQELQSWKNQGFFPYPNNEKGWRKFSFIEYVWLKCIQKLRSLDVSHKKILFLKEVFFKIEKDELITMLQLTPLIKGVGMEKYLIMAQLESDENYFMEVKHSLSEKQFCRFSLLVLCILMFKTNICLTIGENGNCNFFILGPETFGNIIENEVSPDAIQNNSFLLLNLRSIVLGLFEDEKLVLPKNYILGFLNEKQKKVLTSMNEKGIDLITITFKDGDAKRIAVKKSKISNETLNKVARYLNKKNFKDIELKVRGGELIHYGETDIMIL